MEEKEHKIKVKVWNKLNKYIGDFEVPETTPLIVRFGGKLYEYDKTYSVYIEQSQFPYDVGMLNTTNVVKETKS